MPVKNPKEMFVLMLSDLRQGTERTTSLPAQGTGQLRYTAFSRFMTRDL